MSAYVVSPAQISAIVCRMVQFNTVKADAANATANLLMAENVRSVNDRYSLRDKPLRGFYAEEVKGLPCETYSDRQIIAWVRCLEYQSCEHAGWRKSKARRILADFMLDCVGISDLVDHAELSWSLD